MWTLNHAEHSDLLRVLLPTEIPSVTAQAAEPRVSAPWGMGMRREDAVPNGSVLRDVVILSKTGMLSSLTL